MEARDFVVQLSALGFTQSDIAEKTGIPQPTISKVSRGEVADVLSKNYRKLQAFYLSASADAARKETKAGAPLPASPTPAAPEPAKAEG